jgi:hypothetical protein
VGDPFRRPVDLVPTLRAPIGTLADKVRIALLRRRVRSRTPADLLRGPDGSTRDALHEAGFSPTIIERFFQPFLAGVLLDPDLATSRRLFDVYWRCFADGDAVLPAAGMGAIPTQLAAALPEGTVRLRSTVVGVERDEVALADGSRVSGCAVVVATEGPAAARLLGLADPGSRPVCCVWFAADEARGRSRCCCSTARGVGPPRTSSSTPTSPPPTGHRAQPSSPAPWSVPGRTTSRSRCAISFAAGSARSWTRGGTSGPT